MIVMEVRLGDARKRPRSRFPLVGIVMYGTDANARFQPAPAQLHLHSHYYYPVGTCKDLG